MKNRINQMLKKAKERKLLLQSGHLTGHRLNQRMVIVEPTKSLTHSGVNHLLDSNCLLVVDLGNASTKFANNTVALLDLICKERGIRSPFPVYEQYWCVNPELKPAQSKRNQSN